MDRKCGKGFILIIDDEPNWRDFSEITLEDEGYLVETVSALAEAINLLEEDGYDFVVVNSDLLEPQEKEVLNNLINYSSKTRLIVMSDPTLSRTHALAQSRAAFKLGAEDWVSKPMGRNPLIELFGRLFSKFENCGEKNASPA
jgi:DNA-binding NtrC family response regulator